VNKDLLEESLVYNLKKLYKISAPSGFEQPMVKYLKNELDKINIPYEIDIMGNIFVKIAGKKDGPKVMTIAHTDQIGFVVKSIENNGFLRIQNLGMFSPEMCFGRKVIINGEHIGVIGKRSAHLKNEEEEIEWSELYIDVGANNEAEVLELNINIGDPITFVGELGFLGKSKCVYGHPLDDRVGVAIFLTLIKDIKVSKGELIFTFSTQEELGYRGAQVAAYNINPDCAVVVDTIPAGDTPDIDTKKELPIWLGKGPAFTLMGGNIHEGYIAHPQLKDLFIKTSKKNNIPYQLVTRLGPSSNDATYLHLTREGIPSGSITIPRRYSHSPVEVMNLSDLTNTALLLKNVLYECSKIAEYKFIDF